MITTTMSVMNPVRLKLIICMVCLVLQVVYAEQNMMCIQSEREALLQFKAALVDPFGMLSSWNTADCCQWKRIRCSNLTGHILMLDLHDDESYVSGKIHKSLMELPQLKYLNLRENSFPDSHIPEFLGSMSNLRYLDLSSCEFVGKIPTQFGSLFHLKYLNLADNYLEGSIPIQLRNLSNLQKLYLGGFSEAFKIDDGNQWLSNLTSLTHLHLDSISNLNSSHSWLQMILKLPKLRELSLVDCSLADHFILSSRPYKFNSSASLSVLDLSRNTFMSPMIIFQWVSNITTNLVQLDLQSNILEGPKSNHFGMEMNSLEYLDFSSNKFKGDDLKFFVNICTLHSLNLHANNLTEDLPSILHNLSSGCVSHSLQELDLSFNQITGSLPDLSVFSSLKTLLLDRNQLSGKIPEGIKLPSKLESLSISSNSLEGGVPISFGSTCTLELLDLSKNNLTEELTVIFNHLFRCSRYSLRELNLGSNKINGTVPNVLLSRYAGYSLQELDLSMNQISGTGTLPNLLSMFPSLKILYLQENKLNGTIDEDMRFPTELEKLYLSSNSLKGVITDYHFANMSKLNTLELSGNSLTLAFTQNWVPSFQLVYLRLRFCKLGPIFPKWLQTQNNLTYLDISNAGISDVVPKWFWAEVAPKLINLDVSYNKLQGIIPNFPQMNDDSFLYLGSNQFEGHIPPSLRGYNILDLSKNNFSDSLSFFCDDGAGETLSKLDLSNNQLSGQIPDCWSHFRSLIYLNLSDNKFSGKIPTSMGSLLELSVLSLRNNDLTYEVPSSLRNCTELLMLDMTENRLSGSFPSWIGRELRKLQILRLGGNQFYGSLPLQICYLDRIQLLDLSLNNFSGQIPKCIKNFTSMAQKNSHSYNELNELNAFLMWKGSEQMFMNKGLSLLKSIDLSSNHFSEEIPREIEHLFGLVSLNLSRNNLTGKIPSNIGKLTSLEFLDLSRNQLVGSIPSSLTEIDRLTMLDVSHNHLSGMIPTGTQLQSFNTSSYEDNDLCGPPLKKLCTDGEPAQEPIDKLHEDNNLLFTREFYMSMAIGFVISFWGVFGSILIKRSWRHAYFKFLSNLGDAIYVMAAVKVLKWRPRR